MRKLLRKLSLWQKIIVFLVIGIIFGRQLLQKNYLTDGNLYEVISVVDGDTIKIRYEGKTESVRLIGVDTPESVHPDATKNSNLGKCASHYSEKLLEGKMVSLEFDVQERDKYGRLLAYVYLDDEMINKKLLFDGYAQLATYPPNTRYVEDFTKLQQDARNANRGLWNEKNCVLTTTTKTNSVLPLKALCNDDVYDYALDVNKESYQGMCSGHGGIKEKLGRIK